MNKASSISKAIKEWKWLDIRYKQDNEVTVFLAAIKDNNISIVIHEVSAGD